MFGQPNTPFGGGGGGFGQPSNTAPVFGNAAPAGGIFGSPAPAFGQAPNAFGQQQQQAPAQTGFGGGFGAPPPAPVGGGGLFGNAPATAPTGYGGGFGAPAPSGGLFGAPAPAPTGFGGGYGAPAQGSLFAPAPSTGLFGTSPAPAGFGGSGGGFGAAPAGGLFGAPAPAPTGFGGGTSLFGAPAPAPTGFGGFGAPAPATGFGAPATGFGAPAPATGFGAPATGFGAPAPAGGLFGSPAPAPVGFGAPVGGGSLFGSSPVATSATGTRAVPYQVTIRQDGTSTGSSTINLQSISAMPQYQDQSHEELRYADYMQGNRGTAAPAPSAFGGFGAPAPAPVGGLFGSAPASTSAFGLSTGGGLFGSAPAPAFGAAPTGFAQNPAGGGLFGQSPAPAPFGAPAPTFNAPTSSFGNPPASSFGQAPAGGIFGAPGFGAPASSGGLFGSSPAPAPFAPAPTGLFGSPAPAFGAPAPSTGLFGSNPAPAPFGSPAPGLFGQTPASGGLFGPSPAAAPFGQTTPSQFGQAPAPFGAPAPSMFGSTSAPAFGAPAQGGLFGQPAQAPAYGSPYAQAPPAQQQQYNQYQYQPQQPLFAPNAQIVAPGVNEVIEQQIRAMDNQLNDLKKMEVWKGHRASTSPATTPTSQHAPDSFFSTTPRTGALSYNTPRSVAKIRPRGFAQTEPPKASVPLSLTRRDNSGLMSPEAYVRSSQLNLVIRPDSLQRPRKFGLQLESQGPPSPSGLPAETIQPPPAEENTSNEPRTDPSPSPPETQDAGASASSSLRDTHATSPGYEYYQQVIGNSSDGSNQPVTPTANGTPKGKPWYVPKLTKKGYQVSPSVDELATMSEADLASVRRFTVKRPGYGKVEWDGSVDVRGADLDSIVVIEEKDVSVYSMDEEKGSKPEEGTKLNRPAVITFEEVYPKEGVRASAEVKARFAKKVEKATQKMDAEFVSYDSNTGVWKIRVQHFSRYALVDDDTDEENALEPSADEAAPQQQKSLVRRKATPYRQSRMTFEDLEMSESTDFEQDDNMVSDADELTEMDIMLEAEEAARAISDAAKEDVGVLKRRKIVEEINFEDEGEDDESSIAQLTVAESQPDREDVLKALSGRSFCSVLSGKAKINLSRGVCGTRIGRSFRVGWLPDGSFFKLSASSPLLVKMRPVLSDSSAKSVSVALLEAQRNDAVVHSTGEDKCPLFSLPQNCERVASFFPSDDDAKHAFLLLSRLFSEEGNNNLATSDLGEVPLESRRLAAAYNLLLDLCAPDVRKEVAKFRTESLSAVFAALSGGNLEFACDLAAEAGFTLLATTMATSADGRKDINRLLLDVAESGDLSRLTNPVALRILRDVGGEFNWEDKCFRDGDKSLDWRRRLLLRILQNPDVGLLHALQCYESATTAGDAPFPHPHYLEGTNQQVQSLFFRLLRLCADPKTMTVCEAIDPSGYTPFLHDFYLSFHLASAISAASSDMNGYFKIFPLEAEYIMDGYGTQLVMQGAWEWAVFVSLCHVGDGTPEIQRWKTKSAKNLVLRHYHKGDRKAQQRRDFLERKVGVPCRWFEEALCYRAAAEGDDVGCIEHACAFDLNFGREAFVEFVLPRLVFDNKIDRMTTILANMASEAPLDSLAMVMYRYFELDECVVALTSGVEELVESYDDVVFGLLENFECVYDFLSKLNDLLKSKDTSPWLPNALLIPVSEKPVQLSSMVSDTLQRLSLLKVQLDALSRP